MDAPPRLEAGRTWSGYVVDSLLGEGANTAVYLVLRTSDETHWALKVLGTTDARKRIRVEREAIFRDELRHPNIAPALEAIDVDGHPGLVMDFIEGPTLDAWVRTYDPDLVARLQVFRHVLAGVHFAHESNVVHRDLKPSNVLMQPDGRGFIPRITDFGLGKALAPEVGRFGGLTTVNTGLGSPGYAAPEQTRDASSVDERADLFSLGCLLYELICDTAPFAGLSTIDVLRASARSEYADPAALAPGVPADVHALIRELMAPEPHDRPMSVEAVARRIDRVLSDMQIERGTVSSELGTVTSELTDDVSVFYEVASAGSGTLGALIALPAIGMVVGAIVVFAL